MTPISVHRLEQDGEATEETAHQSQKAEGLTSLKSRSTAGTGRACGGSLLSTAISTVATSRRSCSATEASVDRLATANGSTRRRARGRRAHHGARERRGILPLRALRTARVLLTAVGRASVILSAVAHALVAPLLTDEERQCLGVHGDVGRGTVAADALVGEGVRVAGVLLGHGRVV